MKLTASIAVLAAALTAFSVTAAGAATKRAPSAGAPPVGGTVACVHRGARALRAKGVGRGAVRMKGTRNTRFQRIDGLGGRKAGAKRIEATLKPKNGGWVGRGVGAWGGGGEHGGGG